MAAKWYRVRLHKSGSPTLYVKANSTTEAMSLTNGTRTAQDNGGAVSAVHDPSYRSKR